MGEPTPQSNRNEITRIEGEIQTFKAEMKGSVDKTELSASSMKESVDRMEKRQTDFFSKSEDKTARIHKRIDDVEDNVAAVNTLTSVNKTKLAGHVELCDDRQKIEKDNRKEMSGWAKTIIGIVVTAVIFLAGKLTS